MQRGFPALRGSSDTPPVCRLLRNCSDGFFSEDVLGSQGQRDWFPAPLWTTANHCPDGGAARGFHSDSLPTLQCVHEMSH